MDRIEIRSGDCLAIMKQIKDNSIDMILTDLPYGVTACRWDSIIPLEELWEQYKRIARDNSAIVLTASQPFTAQLINSNPRMFKYCWYWVKNMVTGFTFAKYQPMRKVEEVCVFYKKAPIYNPQGLRLVEKTKIRKRKTPIHDDQIYKKTLNKSYESWEGSNYPNNVLNIKTERGLHPTQKPVELMEYLIRTYTNEDMTVLDSCMGSGTTGIACLNTNRKFIGIEKDEKYFEVAQLRLEAHRRNINEKMFIGGDFHD